jgi:hypothetical protein
MNPPSPGAWPRSQRHDARVGVSRCSCSVPLFGPVRYHKHRLEEGRNGQAAPECGRSAASHLGDRCYTPLTIQVRLAHERLRRLGLRSRCSQRGDPRSRHCSCVMTSRGPMTITSCIAPPDSFGVANSIQPRTHRGRRAAALVGTPTGGQTPADCQHVCRLHFEHPRGHAGTRETLGCDAWLLDSACRRNVDGHVGER